MPCQEGLVHSPGRDILSFSSRGLYKKVENIGMASVLHTLEEGGEVATNRAYMWAGGGAIVTERALKRLLTKKGATSLKVAQYTCES